MLELKRKLGQCVVIGDSVQLTVREIRAPIVSVLIEIDSIKVTAPLTIGKTYQATVDGIDVELIVSGVEGREVALRFDAPRELRIDRWERAV